MPKHNQSGNEQFIVGEGVSAKMPLTDGGSNGGLALCGYGDVAAGDLILLGRKAAYAVHQSRYHRFPQVCEWLLLVNTHPGAFPTPSYFHQVLLLPRSVSVRFVGTCFEGRYAVIRNWADKYINSAEIQAFSDQTLEARRASG
jgi:hypothetical protein